MLLVLTFIAVQQLLHVRFDAAMPFVLQHAVHHRVAHRAIAAQRVVADDAVFFSSQALDGFLAGKILIFIAFHFRIMFLIELQMEWLRSG